MDSPFFKDDRQYERFKQAERNFADSPEAAVEVIKGLAYDGSQVSMVFLADLMFHGNYYDSDLDDAAGWYKAAAKAGLVHGTHGLGRVALRKRDYETAHLEFVRAAQEGFAPSMNMLGLMYLRGNGVSSDPSVARQYWEEGWRRHHVWSLHHLAQNGLKGLLGLKPMLQAPGWSMKFIAIGSKVDLERATQGWWTSDDLRI